AACVEFRRADHAEQSGERAGARLCRRGKAALRRGDRHVHPDRQEAAARQAARTESGMSFFNFARRRSSSGRSSSAPVARERLQILLEYERCLVSQSDLITVLRQEILAVVGRHVTVDPDKVQVKVDRGDEISTLAVDIKIPNLPPPKIAVPA